MASLLIKNRQEATQRVMSQKIELNLTQPLSIKNLIYNAMINSVMMVFMRTTDDNLARESDQLGSRGYCHHSPHIDWRMD